MGIYVNMGDASFEMSRNSDIYVDKSMLIAQIKDRQYAAWIADYTGDILLVGISYDKKSKEHACLIETWRKT